MASLDPDTKLRRKECADALTAAGFPTKPATLATKAVRGGGPPFESFGRIPIYPWGLALAWAKSRTSPLRHSTSDPGAPGSAHSSCARGDAGMRWREGGLRRTLPDSPRAVKWVVSRQVVEIGQRALPVVGGR